MYLSENVFLSLFLETFWSRIFFSSSFLDISRAQKKYTIDLKREPDWVAAAAAAAAAHPFDIFTPHYKDKYINKKSPCVLFSR